MVKYSPFVEEIGIAAGGSRGTICWGPPTAFGEHGIRLDRVNVVSYTTGPGMTMQLNAPAKTLGLMTLPEPARRRIFELVYRPADGVKVDVDKDSGFPTGLLIAFGREIYSDWRDKYLFENSLTISATTTESCTTSLSSSKIQQFLRKRYHAVDQQNATPKTIDWENQAFGSTKTITFILNFKLKSRTSLKDLPWSTRAARIRKHCSSLMQVPEYAPVLSLHTEQDRDD